jgi:hypothetical protein
MKKVLMVLCFMLIVPFYAHAWQDICFDLSETATLVMAYRQAGLSPSLLLRETLPNIPIESKEVFEDMVIMAYSHPEYTTEQNKERAIREFRDAWFLGCVEIFREEIIVGERM